ncbi:MAG: NifU family protein [Pseudomonadota bacterium]|nr:NifU family protein [Pseudomonadota bacterium]
MLIETETTPNPLTRKYLPGRTVMATGSRDFPNAQSAEVSPLASALFATGDVDGVFFGRDFVSVSAVPNTPWEELEPDILSILLDHFITDAPLFAPGTASGIAVDPHDDGATMAVTEDPADADIVVQIKELIETRVRPAVAQDGGDIVYRGYARGTLYLALQGACSGCPSSAITLKNGIEGLIKHYVPEVETVEAV